MSAGFRVVISSILVSSYLSIYLWTNSSVAERSIAGFFFAFLDSPTLKDNPEEVSLAYPTLGM